MLARAIGLTLTVALIGRSPGVDLLLDVDPHLNADDHVQPNGSYFTELGTRAGIQL